MTRPARPIGWHADPSGRHLLRWYDGDGWTAEVSDGRSILTDWSTMPPLAGARSLSSLLIPLTPGLVLLALVVVALHGW